MVINKNTQAELERFKQAKLQKVQQGGQAPQVGADTHPSVTPAQANTSDQMGALMAKMQKMEDKLKDVQKDNERLRGVKRTEEENEQNSKSMTAVNDIVASYQGKSFKKHYSFDVVDSKKKIEFDINMRVINAFDVAKIIDLENDWGVQDLDNVLFESIASIKILSLNQVPDWLTDPTKVVRFDIPTQVYEDYQEWAQTFRQTWKG